MADNPLYKIGALVGVDESDQIGRVPGKSAMQLAAEATKNALADAGLTPADVDGVFTCGLSWAPTMQVCEFLGIKARYFDGTSVGGSAFVVHVEHALAAIHAGLCNVAVIVHGEHGYSGRNMPDPGGGFAPAYSSTGQFTLPYGIQADPVNYAMACSQHMSRYGTTHEQLADIAVSTREWANKNPKAFFYDKPITRDDVLNSRWITYPFHLLDCCLVTDAAGAVVVAKADIAKNLKKKPAWVLGTGEAQSHLDMLSMEDYTVSPAKISGEQAFASSGVSHKDIDLAMIYDSFTYTVLITLESLGFCKPGEGGAFVSNGRLGPGGEFPVNTNGGGLSYTHPGMYGIFTMLEAVRQLRGEAGERQLSKCDIALCNGTGGDLSSAGTIILSNS